MKKTIQKLLVASVPLYLTMANALATPDGECTRWNPCAVPEPGTPYLFLGAIGVAALVIKLRKKK